jgi:hypothetical protein
MGVARIFVTPELLRKALHLPHTSEIAWAEMEDPYTIALYVRDPDLHDKPIVEGEKPPLVMPSFRQNVPVEFLSWNQDGQSTQA